VGSLAGVDAGTGRRGIFDRVWFEVKVDSDEISFESAYEEGAFRKLIESGRCVAPFPGRKGE
jgi:hypothetical protein